MGMGMGRNGNVKPIAAELCYHYLNVTKLANPTHDPSHNLNPNPNPNPNPNLTLILTLILNKLL